MFSTCSKCSKLFRNANTEKHSKKCEGASFKCCDCGQEMDVLGLSKHIKCPNSVRSVAPILFNPNSKTVSPTLDTLLIVDRIAFDNTDESLKEIYVKLCTVDCLPKKKDGFISYIMSFCKIEKDKAETIWSQVEIYRKKQQVEKLTFSVDKKCMCSVIKVEKKETIVKKGDNKVHKPVVRDPKLEKLVNKLIQLNRDKYTEKDELKKIVVDMVCGRDPLAVVRHIESSFDKLYSDIAKKE